MKCTQNKPIKLHSVVIMIKDYKHLIGLQYIHMKQMHLKWVKVKWWFRDTFLLKITQIVRFMMKMYYKHNKDLKVYT